MAQPLELFAYETLLDQRRMRETAGEWDTLRPARLPGTRIAFLGWSDAWTSAVATLEPSPGDSVHGVLYRILPYQLREIAQALPGHRETAVTVETDEGLQEAVAFVPTDREAGLRIAESYLRAVEEGLRQHGFTPEIRRRVRDWAAPAAPPVRRPAGP